MSEYEAGDIVKLRSGSPDMTVQRVLDDGALLVAWVDGEQHMNTFMAPAVCFGLRRKSDGTEPYPKRMIIADREAFSA